jgi:hypothetical protein
MAARRWAENVKLEALAYEARLSPFHLHRLFSAVVSALERWMEANGHTPAGSPWESYLTDPAEHADPSEWRTEVFWPIR